MVRELGMQITIVASCRVVTAAGSEKCRHRQPDASYARCDDVYRGCTGCACGSVPTEESDRASGIAQALNSSICASRQPGLEFLGYGRADAQPCPAPDGETGEAAAKRA